MFTLWVKDVPIFVTHSRLMVAVACSDPSTSTEYKYVSAAVNAVSVTKAIKKPLKLDPHIETPVD